MRVGIVDSSVARGRAIAKVFEKAGAGIAHLYAERWRDVAGDVLEDDNEDVAPGVGQTGAEQVFDLVLLHVEDASQWRGANVLGRSAFKYTGGWGFSSRSNRGSYVQRIVNADSITVSEARALMDWVAAGGTGAKPRLIEPNEEHSNMLAAAAILCQGYLAVTASESEGAVHTGFMREALEKMGWSPVSEVKSLNTGVVQSPTWWKGGLGLNETAVTAPDVLASMSAVKVMLDRALSQQAVDAELVAEAYLQLCSELETIG